METDASTHKTTAEITVSLLADLPGAIPPVAHMRWQEWGHAPEPEDPEWWLDVTAREAGREQLPVTFVATDGDSVVGAVGLDAYDLDERRDTSPWITGMIVRPDRRDQGVGRILLRHLEHWAAARDIAEAWVGTDLARTFYEKCRWTVVETFTTAAGVPMTVLHKKLVERR